MESTDWEETLQRLIDCSFFHLFVVFVRGHFLAGISFEVVIGSFGMHINSLSQFVNNNLKGDENPQKVKQKVLMKLDSWIDLGKC